MRGTRMTGIRWWHLLFAATLLVLVVIAVQGLIGGEGQQVGALAALAVLAIAYATIGRAAFERQAFALPFGAILIACSAVAVAFSPSMATVQAIACPLLWILLRDTRVAIAANVVLTASIAVGFVIALGIDDGLPQAVFIEGVSLVGSLALGLWISRIADDSAERLRLLDELREAQSQVAALGREAGASGERERLAREIHDTIAQSLTGLVLMGQRARRELDAGETDALQRSLALFEDTARDALVETRALVANSAPSDLTAGLVPALERLGRRFGRETGVAVTVQALSGGDGLGSASPPAPSRDLEVVLLRCAQEALANVRKHAGACTASLVLRAGVHSLDLVVHDDGQGFDPTLASDGYGLEGMRDRLALVRGSLEVTSVPGVGTTLTISVPSVPTRSEGAPPSSGPQGSGPQGLAPQGLTPQGLTPQGLAGRVDATRAVRP